VVDVDKHRLDAEGRLNPPQRGSEGQRITPTGKSDDNAITGRKSRNARARQ
jgi:hypothetical protein